MDRIEELTQAFARFPGIGRAKQNACLSLACVPGAEAFETLRIDCHSGERGTSVSGCLRFLMEKIRAL